MFGIVVLQDGHRRGWITRASRIAGRDDALTLARREQAEVVAHAYAQHWGGRANLEGLVFRAEVVGE